MFSNTCAMTLAQKSDRILAQTRGLSGATPSATQLIEELRWALEENRREVERIRADCDEARKEYCMAQSHVDEEYGKTTLPEEIAEERGWDCFNKNPTGNA